MSLEDYLILLNRGDSVTVDGLSFVNSVLAGRIALAVQRDNQGHRGW
jgi:hypothetical protein